MLNGELFPNNENLESTYHWDNTKINNKYIVEDSYWLNNFSEKKWFYMYVLIDTHFSTFGMLIILLF